MIGDKGKAAATALGMSGSFQSLLAKACQVEGGTGQAGVTEPWLEQHSVPLEQLLVTIVDPARRRRRKTRGLAQRRRRKRTKSGLGQGRRRRRRRRREAGLIQEARPAALDPTPTDPTLSATVVHLSHTKTVLCCNVFEIKVLAIFVQFWLWPQS